MPGYTLAAGAPAKPRAGFRYRCRECGGPAAGSSIALGLVGEHCQQHRRLERLLSHRFGYSATIILAAYYVTKECYSSWIVRNHVLRDITYCSRNAIV